MNAMWESLLQGLLLITSIAFLLLQLYSATALAGWVFLVLRPHWAWKLAVVRLAISITVLSAGCFFIPWAFHRTWLFDTSGWPLVTNLFILSNLRYGLLLGYSAVAGAILRNRRRLPSTHGDAVDVAMHAGIDIVTASVLICLWLGAVLANRG